jgi:hypothetical protein
VAYRYFRTVDMFIEWKPLFFFSVPAYIMEKMALRPVGRNKSMHLPTDHRFFLAL